MEEKKKEKRKEELLKDPVVRDFVELQKEIQIMQNRLQKVEEYKDSVRPSVYERVKKDYKDQLIELLKKIQPQKAKLKSRLEDMEKHYEVVERKMDKYQEALEELSLRHLAGEYDEERFNTEKEKIEKSITEIDAELQQISEDIEIYREHLSIEIPPELLQEVAKELEEETGGREIELPVLEEEEEKIEEEMEEKEISEPEEIERVEEIESVELKNKTAQSEEEVEVEEEKIFEDLEDEMVEQTIKGMEEEFVSLEDDEEEFTKYLDSLDEELELEEEKELESFEKEERKIIPILDVIEGEYKGQSFPIISDYVKIGRAPKNDIQLAIDTSVSRFHAILKYENGAYKIIDNNSANGTYVNGVRIREQVLNHNDQILIGHTKLLFRIPK